MDDSTRARPTTEPLTSVEQCAVLEAQLVVAQANAERLRTIGAVGAAVVVAADRLLTFMLSDADPSAVLEEAHRLDGLIDAFRQVVLDEEPVE